MDALMNNLLAQKKKQHYFDCTTDIPVRREPLYKKKMRRMSTGKVGIVIANDDLGDMQSKWNKSWVLRLSRWREMHQTMYPPPLKGIPSSRPREQGLNLIKSRKDTNEPLSVERLQNREVTYFRERMMGYEACSFLCY